jgi:hypothetical protein
MKRMRRIKRKAPPPAFSHLSFEQQDIRRAAEATAAALTAFMDDSVKTAR